MVPTIGATGTIEPQEVVDVGAQVAGQILSFGIDANGNKINYRSPVEKGTILARIDDRLYRADKSTADAQLALAQAGVKRAVADLKQMQATLEEAKSDWDRAVKLGPSDALSLSDYNKYKAAFTIASANVDVGQAAIDQAAATVTQAQAAVDRAIENIDYCTIVSPVKGVIIDRRVNIGQTVVSSLNAPSLFLIAKDLRQMQIWVSVNEADIGDVYTGQPVTFGVDKSPGETFHGIVGIIRLNAVMTQNVVTYPVEVNTDNSELKLLPYLTANVEFEVARHKNVLLVPNAALRWYPDPEMVAPDVRKAMADKQKTAKEDAEATDKPKSATTRPTTRPTSKEPRPRNGLDCRWKIRPADQASHRRQRRRQHRSHPQGRRLEARHPTGRRRTARPNKRNYRKHQPLRAPAGVGEETIADSMGMIFPSASLSPVLRGEHLCRSHLAGEDNPSALTGVRPH